MKVDVVSMYSDDDLQEIQHVLRYGGDPPHKMAVERSGCSCVGKDCGCCLDLSIPQIKFKDMSKYSMRNSISIFFQVSLILIMTQC